MHRAPESMEAILLIGIQAAGKSTFYRRRFFDTHVRLSLDLFRTRYRERRMLEVCLETRMRFVVDNTNATVRERARYIVPARAAGFAIHGYFFVPDPKGCYERNKERGAAVPAAGLFGTLKRLERPCHEEGFDMLWQVELRENGEFAVCDYAPASRGSS
jgi:predicted kinase